jgi:hypothetical protein
MAAKGELPQGHWNNRIFDSSPPQFFYFYHDLSSRKMNIILEKNAGQNI